MLQHQNEKKHNTIYPIRLIALDCVATYPIHYFFAVCRFCADADSDREHHPIKHHKKREEDISHHFFRLFYMEYAMHLLGI
jgi:hypothetical protein